MTDKPKTLTRAKLMEALVTIGMCNKDGCDENLCPRIRATIDALFEYRERMRSFLSEADSVVAKELNLGAARHDRGLRDVAVLRRIVWSALDEAHVSLGWCAERGGINLIEMRDMRLTEGE